MSARGSWYDRPKLYYVPEDARSMRGNSPLAPKDSTIFRVGVVGDSFTFAPFMQFDDSFPARIERMLNLNRGNVRAEVINYGAPGLSTSHEVVQARNALKAKPDLLILQITLNDLELKPYAPTGLRVVKNEHGVYVVKTPATEQNWLSRHSKLYSLIRQRYYGYSQGKTYEQYYFDLFSNEAAMRQFRESLGAIARLAKKDQVPFAAVLFPLFGTEINDRYAFHSLHEKVGAVLAELEIPALDLEQIYRGIPAERLQVIPGEDSHPNEIAHRMAAEAIYSWLVERKLVPESMWIKRGYLTRRKVAFDGAEHVGAELPSVGSDTSAQSTPEELD